MDFTEPLIVVSDIHIRDGNDARARTLLHAIDKLDPKKTHTFVLLGDIFDFCFGRRAYFRKRFAAIGNALEKLSAKGVRVVFVEGNHEFSMANIGWKGIEIIDTDLTLAIKGKVIKFCHGDQLLPDPSYETFRKLVKSPLTHYLVSLIPPRWLNAYALWHANTSRNNEKPVNHEKVLKHADHWLGQGVFEHGVFGHFHQPYCEPKKEGHGQILCLPCWDIPNFLAFDGNGFYRYFFFKSGNFERRKAHSMLT